MSRSACPRCGQDWLIVAPEGNECLSHHRFSREQLDESLAQKPIAGQIGDGPSQRLLTITKASEIKPACVRWMWEDRLALGTLGLLAGREGTGKSTAAYWIGARITKGELTGEFYGRPRAVIACATEDSWAHTIVPRLMAAGADLDLVYRVGVTTSEGYGTELSLPNDLLELESIVHQTGAALLILDPLISRLSADLNSHVDHEVRRALEPVVWLAERVGMAVLGIIHHNKSGAADPLQLVMGSKAFTAVARSDHTVIPDPDDETGLRRLFGTPKNNLGRTDLPTLSFTIVGWTYETDDGTGWTGQIVWGDDFEGTIFDALDRGKLDTDARTATQEAADWLSDYMTKYGPKHTSALLKKDGLAAGHSVDALKRARRKLGLAIVSEGFPRITYWLLQSERLEHGRDKLPRLFSNDLGSCHLCGAAAVTYDAAVEYPVCDQHREVTVVSGG